MTTGLTKEEYYGFVEDALLGDIVVGGHCRNNCVFCWAEHSKKTIGRKNFTNYISLEDLKSVIKIIGKLNSAGPSTIGFGDGSYFTSCEPFLHPQYLELLKMIHRYYPNSEKTTATVGKHIDPAIYGDLKKMNVSLWVSVNSFDKETRSRIMKSKEDYEGVLRLLKECSDIIYATSFIYLGDLDVFKKDIETLYSIDDNYENKQIKLWLPHYSQYSSPGLKELYDEAHKTWEKAIRFLCENNIWANPALCSLSEHPKETSKLPARELLREDFDNRLTKAKSLLKRQNVKLEDVGFLIPESCWGYSEKYEDTINRIFVKNIVYGGSYMVSAMLTKEDVLYAVKNNPSYKHYTLPNEVRDYFDCDIAGYNLAEYGLSLFIV